MIDTDNSNNEQPRLYTETQVLELLQRLRNEEQSVAQRAREERDLPLEIGSSLDNLTKQRYLDNFGRYKRDVSKELQ
ncbi:hypothetical protein G6F43_013087 [Rhizopus delemar]|nr:hypothetical protein G6F43_013087 [Rhizopus delemar]